MTRSKNAMDLQLDRLLKFVRYLIVFILIMTFVIYTFVNKTLTSIKTNVDDIAYVQTLNKTNTNTKEVLKKYFKNFTKIPQDKQKIAIAEYDDVNIVKYDQTTQIKHIDDFTEDDIIYLGFNDNISKNYLNTPLDDIILVFYNSDNVTIKSKERK